MSSSSSTAPRQAPSPLEASLGYAARGWRVFPCWGVADGECMCPRGADCPNPGKHPIPRNGFHAATTDPDRIRAWWSEHPEANPAIRTGDGLVVLDLDVTKGKNGPGALRELYGAGLPRTAVARTGSGGLHLFFRSEESFPSSAGKLAPGVDVRGEGGYVVAAPARHISGRTYEFAGGDFAPLPETLAQHLRPRQLRVIEGGHGAFPAATADVLDAARAALEAHGPAVEGDGGDEHTFRAAAILRNDFALTEAEAWPLFVEWNAGCSPPWGEYELAAKFNGGAKYAKRPLGEARAQLHRPRLKLVAGRLAATAEEAERALVGAGVQVFNRGGVLVRPVVEEVDAAHGRKTKIARLKPVDAAYLRWLLSREIAFSRFDARRKCDVTADPPLDLAVTILSRAGDWAFPSISGVIGVPTMRPDGSIVSREGFDAATGLFLCAPPPIPPMADRPTRADALEALARLEALGVEFPFVDAPSRSVFASALLTTVCRGACPVVPGHAISASTPGTGKSYLVDTAAFVVLGQPAPVMAAGATPEETEKRLGAALIAGQQIISIDNVSGGLGGDALCQLIERPSPQVRVLGASELRTVPGNRTSVFATGNNLQILGDVTRRFLLCRLEANLERPELRQFRGDPRAVILADRGRFIADALTVCRAYVVAGRPSPAPRLASFGEWSDTVRSALMWLGRADPVATMEQARAEDPTLALFRNLVVAWAESLGTGQGNARTSAELLSIVDFAGAGSAELRDCLLLAASNRGRPDARTLGKWLSRHKGRITKGFRLVGEADGHGHAAKWWVDGFPSAVAAVESGSF